MNLAVLADWARTHPYPTAVLGVLAGVLAYAARRVRRSLGHVPGAVVMAAIGAMVSTAYSADTSWNFARDHLHMTSASERGVMFAAAEIGLFSMALMARQNLRTQGAPGTPGVLVWVVTGIMVIPAYSESGFIAGTVRAFVGPIMAALLWHLAMGIELRHATGDDSQSLPAVLARELRERLLSRFGLAVRGRDAAQITRDRWTGIATRRAAHLADLEAAGARTRRVRRARRRLAAAVDRTDAGVLVEQRAVLLERIAAYRHASGLASVELPSPWQMPVAVVDVERVPAPEVQAVEVYPQLLAAVPEAYPAVTEGEKTPADLPPFPGAVLAAESPRTRVEVRAEYTPEYAPEPEEDDSPPPPGEDTYTATARAEYHDGLAAGRAPSIRALKNRFAIGQPRAERIRSELENTAPPGFVHHIDIARAALRSTPGLTGGELALLLGGEQPYYGAPYADRVLAAARNDLEPTR
ncbi:hypothetical protein [Actinacidiphila oryziradicis]|uniref:DUF2637 domain-containing protein n=1 Tax=Actinacidiphila oryziradicis TaxID=2571141 RepID=A0A4U0T985_9ACTN|nr:hypothetical protein [Actinacidiphila oryziradicis]TKA13175.1 hypothetical protein FCI23_00055 [Actinacidiphila oryziradicis]